MPANRGEPAVKFNELSKLLMPWLAASLFACAGVGGNQLDSGANTAVGLDGSNTVDSDSTAQNRPILSGAPDPIRDVDQFAKLSIAVEVIECVPTQDGKVNAKFTGQLLVSDQAPLEKKAEMEALLSNRWVRFVDTENHNFLDVLSDDNRNFTVTFETSASLPLHAYLMPRTFPAPENPAQIPCFGNACTANGKRDLGLLLMKCSDGEPPIKVDPDMLNNFNP